MGRLQGKVAVITGANSGIGLAAAKLFAAEGAHVFMTGRRKKELDAAVAEVGRNARGVQGDVSKLADLDHLFAIVRDEAGAIDVLFANAGGGEFVALGSITEEHFDKTFSTNVKGTLFTVQKALPLLRDGSSIILTGSTAATKGTQGFSVLKLINGMGRAEVAAAHIRPVEASGPDIVSNGIALSGTAHWMFDRGLISLADNLEILISRQTNDLEGVRSVINKTGHALEPRRPSDRPHPNFLKWHREHCFKQ
jgi:NAD(P)-dependent dehydrogenase (short-subunit alcohol dehydrogenase family)